MNKVLSNLIWKFAERIGSQLVSLIISTILARTLLPSDYGTIALVTVLMTILRVFIDGGLSTSLIQKKDADDLDFSTVFFANIVLCFIIYLLIFTLAPAIASFYSEPILIPLIRILSITLIIGGFTNVQTAYISKNMLFKKFFFATLIGTILSGMIGIIMAKQGFGVWSLVAQQLSYSIINSIIMWVSVEWRPSLVFSFSRFCGLFGFGSKLLLSALIDTGYSQFRQLIIAKLYTPDDLAYYNKGESFPVLLVNNINASIDSVLLPTMSVEQNNKSNIKSMMRKSIKSSVYILAPMLLGLAAIADKVILILLTDKWSNSIPYLRIFCIIYLFYPIHTSNLNAIKAMGRSDIFLRLEIIKKIIGITLMIISMRISVWAMCLNALIVTIISSIINAWPNKKLLNYSYFEQIVDLAPYLFLSTVMATIVFFIGLLNIKPIILLIIQILIGIALYILGSVLFRFEEFDYFLEILKKCLNKLINNTN